MGAKTLWVTNKTTSEELNHRDLEVLIGVAGPQEKGGSMQEENLTSGAGVAFDMRQEEGKFVVQMPRSQL